jgi:hypothetical protein
MKKVALLAMIAAVTLSVPAQAKIVHHKQHVASNQSTQCFIPTDNRGYGYWVDCGSLTQAQHEAIDKQSLLSSNGGGGGGGGGGK